MKDFINQLILGDNLEILKSLPNESVDLIYLDPPFFSNRNYEVIWGDDGEIRSFKDRWSGGIDHYISWLKERVEQMYRILKPTGSIFLHCDYHADAYIRVFILDKLFGENNFLSHVTWKRTFNSGSSKSIAKKFPMNTDSIFWYSKSKKYTFNKITRPLNENALKRYDKVDELGRRFKWNPLKTVSKERLEALLASGEAKITSTSKYPVYKHYLDESKGVLIDNLWEDIGQIHTKDSGERIGYPTQKPEALLERIITCASNENDVILDPFVGGGTTVAVADRLKRKWIGVDQSVQAVKVSEMRLQKQQDLLSDPFIVKLYKYDYDTLRYKDAFAFESWIIEQMGGTPNTKQRGDFGLDGVSKDRIPIQVKRSDNIGRNVIDNFKSACQRFWGSSFNSSPKMNIGDDNLNPNMNVGVIKNQSLKNSIDNNSNHENNSLEMNLKVINNPEIYLGAMGILIAFSFGKGAIQEVARLKNEENIIIKLITVDEIVPIAKKPKLSLNINELASKNTNKEIKTVEFKASAESEFEIEFFAWDFNYNVEKGFNPEIMIDKEGIQIKEFKSGIHEIAVKVVDNQGLESLEIVKLSVNGGVKKV